MNASICRAKLGIKQAFIFHSKFERLFLTNLSIGVLLLPFVGCDSSPTAAQNNRANQSIISSATANLSRAKSVMTIRQNTVGRINDFSVGVRAINSAGASLAIWNQNLPQAARNDYNVTLTVKTGETIAIGDKFYSISKITEGDGKTPLGEVSIETEPVSISAIRLDKNSLPLPERSVLELHNLSVEVVSVETANGKPWAKIEVYSNDVPKTEAAKTADGVRQITVRANDKIALGAKQHLINAIHPPTETTRGIVEISIAPIQ